MSITDDYLSAVLIGIGSGHGSSLTFNINDGYLDATLRGYRQGLLTAAEYRTLTQCESLEDLKVQLQQTDYGDFLANEPTPLQTATILEKCTEKLVNEFNYIRYSAVEPLATFLNYITYGYMIDNAVLLISGTLHERDPNEMLEKCHPLGMFSALNALMTVNSTETMYNYVIVDTPLAPFFEGCISDKDLDELHIEIIRNTVYKAYLEDFYHFCQSLGGDTALVMGKLLQFEADRRAINITMNSFGTDLTKDDRAKLYPSIGLLAGEGLEKLSKADDVPAVHNALATYQEYRNLVPLDDKNEDRSLEDNFFEYEVQLNKDSFDQQFHYGVFYSWLKLKEQEIRNILWISECIAQRQKHKMNQIITIW